MFKKLILCLWLLGGSILVEADESCSSSHHFGPVKAFPLLPAQTSSVAMVQSEKDPSFWLLAMREGKIISFDNSPTVSSFTNSLDISQKVTTEVEMGLTSITLHPDFPNDPRVFIIYNDKTKKNQTTLSSFVFDQQTKAIASESEYVILTLPKGALFHVAGHLSFGPDGFLYASFGDDGYTPHFAQDNENLHGTIIRIDINQKPYSIPKDNPFNVGQDRCKEGFNDNTCPEIWAYGFRNPWRFSFDSQTEILWGGDVGEDDFEEINIVEAGNNYGWPRTEGYSCFSWKICIKWWLTLPVQGYDLPTPQSIVGGFVYRGKQIPQLQGHYLFSDVYGQSFYSMDTLDTSKILTHFEMELMIVSMAQSADREIYLLNFAASKTGENIYRLDNKKSCGNLG